jgi:aminomuconate-semialdehyde/2-hydroxymuconate-6-semialdehyde dehydrogenase
MYERFKADFVSLVSKLVVGDPLEAGTQQGALVSEGHMGKVLGYIDLARSEGGKILCGGSRAVLHDRCKDGYFVTPTVIEGLSPSSRTNQEEIFGPVVTLTPFDSEDEVVSFANSTRYGLAANVWTKDRDKAHRVAHNLESGIVWINCWMLRDLRTPFGGVKDSGVGREGGDEALRFFTKAPKTISWNSPA